MGRLLIPWKGHAPAVAVNVIDHAHLSKEFKWAPRGLSIAARAGPGVSYYAASVRRTPSGFGDPGGAGAF